MDNEAPSDEKPPIRNLLIVIPLRLLAIFFAITLISHAYQIFLVRSITTSGGMIDGYGNPVTPWEGVPSAISLGLINGLAEPKTMGLYLFIGFMIYILMDLIWGGARTIRKHHG
jgi:hypothetical protein